MISLPLKLELLQTILQKDQAYKGDYEYYCLQKRIFYSQNNIPEIDYNQVYDRCYNIKFELVNRVIQFKERLHKLVNKKEFYEMEPHEYFYLYTKFQ